MFSCLILSSHSNFSSCSQNIFHSLFVQRFKQRPSIIVGYYLSKAGVGNHPNLPWSQSFFPLGPSRSLERRARSGLKSLWRAPPPAPLRSPFLLSPPPAQAAPCFPPGLSSPPAVPPVQCGPVPPAGGGQGGCLPASLLPLRAQHLLGIYRRHNTEPPPGPSGLSISAPPRRSAVVPEEGPGRAWRVLRRW